MAREETENGRGRRNVAGPPVPLTASPERRLPTVGRNMATSPLPFSRPSHPPPKTVATSRRRRRRARRCQSVLRPPAHPLRCTHTRIAEASERATRRRSSFFGCQTSTFILRHCETVFVDAAPHHCRTRRQ